MDVETLAKGHDDDEGVLPRRRMMFPLEALLWTYTQETVSFPLEWWPLDTLDITHTTLIFLHVVVVTLGVILRLLAHVGRVLASRGPMFHSLSPTFHEKGPTSP
jgi:hypothetical protein